MFKHKTLILSCFMENSPQAIPLAASILKSYVADIPGLKVKIMNLTLAVSIEDSVSAINREKADSIGFSVYIWNSSYFKRLISAIKKQQPDVIIYCGGPEISDNSALFFNDLCDYLIVGEGEIPFRKLMTDLINSREKKPALLLDRSHLENLDDIPSPFLSGILDPSEYEGLVWEISRGCPFNCAFCGESRGVSGVRYYSTDRISAELDYFEEKQVEQIFILDPTFNINKERTLKLLKLIADKTPYIHYTIEIRAEFLDRETADAFSNIHCSLQIGLQSSHKRILKKLNRNIDRKQFIEKIDLLNHYGVVFGLDLIYGLPGDNIQSFLESFDFAVERIPNHLDIFRLSVFPGTELYDRSSDYGLDFMTDAPYSILSTNVLDQTELIELDRFVEDFDFFYNKGIAAPWLLSVLDIASLSPSDFFTRFSRYRRNSGADFNDPYNLQTDFLQKLFYNEASDTLLAPVMDLVLFHHLFSECLRSEPVIREKNFENTSRDNTPFERSSCIKTGIFSYDVTLYYELGMIDIASFVNDYEREVSYGFFFNIEGNVQVMALDQQLYRYLSALDGNKTNSEILSMINAAEEDLAEFIEFLKDSNLIRPHR